MTETITYDTARRLYDAGVRSSSAKFWFRLTSAEQEPILRSGHVCNLLIDVQKQQFSGVVPYEKIPAYSFVELWNMLPDDLEIILSTGSTIATKCLATNIIGYRVDYAHGGGFCEYYIRYFSPDELTEAAGLLLLLLTEKKLTQPPAPDA